MPAARALSPLPALPIDAVIPDIPPVDAVFHSCVVAQRMATDIVIYTRDLGRLITVAYPIGPLGVRIVPSGVFSWMERRGLVIECFCALVSGEPTPARFVAEFLSKHMVVRCHHVDSRCGFFLDLTKIHLMTMLESPYEHIPTLPFGNPDMRMLLSRWRNIVTRDTTLLRRTAPYFDGYFSIHVSMYPGIQQLRSGLLQPLVFNSPYHRRASSYHPYNCHRQSLSPTTRSASIQSTPCRSSRHGVLTRGSPSNPRTPSRVAASSRTIERARQQFSEHEVEALTAVRMGFGISQETVDDLFEKCDHCQMNFMRSALRAHIKEAYKEGNAGNEKAKKDGAGDKGH